MRWNKVTIVGVGLLGGSLGLFLRKHRLAGQVTGLVRRKASIRESTRAGAVDTATTDPKRALRDAELVLLCTPLGRMLELAQTVFAHTAPGTIVSDVGSVKAPVVRALEPMARKAGARFIGAHPMAGSEKAGVAHARPDLFNGAVCVLTPTRHTCPEALAQLEVLWTAAGAVTVKMTPTEHDRLAAFGSHLPHAVAVALTRAVLGTHRRNQELLCATGFKDTTRVASSLPEMWCDILLDNAEHTTHAITAFIRHLQKLQQAILRRDRYRLLKTLAAAKQLRDQWCSLREARFAPQKRARSNRNME